MAECCRVEIAAIPGYRERDSSLGRILDGLRRLIVRADFLWRRPIAGIFAHLRPADF
jgi:hypothetical protein